MNFIGSFLTQHLGRILFRGHDEDHPPVRAAEYTVDISGALGRPGGSLHILDAAGNEVLTWDFAEWQDNPTLVYVIADAVHMAAADPEKFSGKMGFFQTAGV